MWSIYFKKTVPLRLLYTVLVQYVAEEYVVRATILPQHQMLLPSQR